MPPRVILSQLPDRCAITLGSGKNAFRGYDTRCLERNFGYTANLPQTCRRTVRFGGKKIDAFGTSCLRQRSNDTAWLNRK